MSLRGIRRLAALIVVTSTQSAAQISGFEISYAGTAPSPGPNVEGWTSFGQNTFVPFGPLAAPVSGFPTEQVQWVIVDSFGTGLVPPPQAGVPPVLPLTGGTNARMRLPLTVPTAAGLSIAFDWTYVSRECPNDAMWNDFLTIDLTDSNGARVLNLLYRDTFSSTLAGPAMSPNAGNVVPGAAFCATAAVTREEGPVGTPKTAVIAIPPGLHGQSLWFEVNVGNATDFAFSSYAYLDDVRWIGGPAPPLLLHLGQPLGSGSIRLIDTGLTPGGHTLNLISFEPAPGGVGSGPYLGLWTATPSNLVLQATVPIGTLPFSFIPTGASFIFGPLTGAPTGLTVEAVAVEITWPTLGRVSPVAALSIN